MIDQAMVEHWGFRRVRDVPGRGDCAVQRFVFTAGLLVGVRLERLWIEYEARYCYETAHEAVQALDAWDGQGDPPGDWIKEKISERLGPGAKVSEEERAAHHARLEARDRARGWP
jgi:hypothetical protein